MDYKLLKELKDAGFPFVAIDQVVANSPEGRDLVYQDKAFYFDRGVALYKFPTLSELIEACGKNPITLKRIGVVDNQWRAECYDPPKKWLFEDAETPEEAVANLFIALKKNGKSPTNRANN